MRGREKERDRERGRERQRERGRERKITEGGHRQTDRHTEWRGKQEPNRERQTETET